jgi:hypothetical protein
MCFFQIFRFQSGMGKNGGSGIYVRLSGGLLVKKIHARDTVKPISRELKQQNLRGWSNTCDGYRQSKPYDICKKFFLNFSFYRYEKAGFLNTVKKTKIKKKQTKK